MEKKTKCQFEKDGFCHALSCYSEKKCGARDENGQPKYSSDRIADRRGGGDLCGGF